MKSAPTINPAMPKHDYGPALRNAVSWLGERYLLAEPVRRRKEEQRPWFSTTRGWYPQAARA